MSDPFRADGIWWLPGASGTPSTGTLVLDGKRPRLESVIGPIGDLHPDTHFAPGPAVIHGRSHRGDIYTCFRCFFAGTDVNHTPTGGHAVANIDVIDVLQGVHFDTAADAEFRQAKFTYSNLHIWLYQHEGILVSKADGARSVRCNRQELWNSHVGEGFTIESSYRFLSNSKFSPREEKFSFEDAIRVRSQEPRPFADFLPVERKFRSLVNLLADCQLEVASGVFRDDTELPIEATILGRKWGGGFASREDPIRGGDPVSFNSIGNFSNVITKWFAEYPKLESVVNLYLFGKQNSFLDIGNMFLDLIQALEAYHRTFRPGTFMGEDEYKAQIRGPLFAAIPASTPDDLRDRLKSAIRYGYEYSLMRRLNDLVEVLPASPLFDEVREKKFRVRTKETRNTMIHQISEPQHPAMEGGELLMAINRWREVLFALILKTIEIPDSTIMTAVAQLRGREGTFVVL